MQVIGEAVDIRNLGVELEAARPDLLLLDWSTLGSHPGEMLPALRARYPHLLVIVMSGQPEVRRAALAAGADAFISKTDSPDQLLAILKEVATIQATGSDIKISRFRSSSDIRRTQ